MSDGFYKFFYYLNERSLKLGADFIFCPDMYFAETGNRCPDEFNKRFLVEVKGKA